VRALQRPRTPSVRLNLLSTVTIYCLTKYHVTENIPGGIFSLATLACGRSANIRLASCSIDTTYRTR